MVNAEIRLIIFFAARYGEGLVTAMAPHSSTLAWKIPWMGEPGGLQSMGSQSQTRLSDFPFTFHFHALEKEMTTHSSILAWRIPGMGETGGLPSMGSYRVRQDWSDLTAAWRSSILSAKTRPGADCGSDHELLIAKFNPVCLLCRVGTSYSFNLA